MFGFSPGLCLFLALLSKSLESSNSQDDSQNNQDDGPDHLEVGAPLSAGSNRLEAVDDREAESRDGRASYAYIDGSFNKNTKYYGYGGFIIHNNKKYIIQRSGNDENLVEMRYITGEIYGYQETINKAIELGIKNIDIFYDFARIEKWATGEWKRNKKGSKDYYDFIQSINSKIKRIS